MSQDTLQEIQVHLAQFSTIAKTGENPKIGIGLVNVNRRIKLHYGQNYGLEIKSTLDVGTEVTIRIPTITAALK
jgi:two-component system sensor histidine kinase YesM